MSIRASDNPFPSLLVQEAADDGSDFSNPAADYRRLFLGEDGKLHLKDSAGTVTDVDGGAGSVATDAIWDAAGDLAVGSGSNTAVRKAAGSDYQVLRARSAATNGLEWSGGVTLVAELTAGASEANLDLTSIPGTGKHIVIEAMLRSAKSAAYDDLRCQVNADTGSNSDYQLQSAYQTTNVGGESIGGAFWLLGQPAGASATAGLFSYYRLCFPYYADTNYSKIAYMQASELTARSSGSVLVRHGNLMWRSTSAITSVKFYFPSDNIAQNSRPALYLTS